MHIFLLSLSPVHTTTSSQPSSPYPLTSSIPSPPHHLHISPTLSQKPSPMTPVMQEDDGSEWMGVGGVMRRRGRMNWIREEGGGRIMCEEGFPARTVLSRASAHPPILTVLWFLEVLCVTAHHAKFLRSESESRSAEFT